MFLSNAELIYMNAEGQMAQQGSKRFRISGKLALIFLLN